MSQMMDESSMQPELEESARPAFRLPFAFAKRHQVVLDYNEQQQAILYYTGDLASQVMLEIRRALGQAFAPQHLDGNAFERKLTGSVSARFFGSSPINGRHWRR